MDVLRWVTGAIHANDYVDPDSPLIYSWPLTWLFFGAVGTFIAVFFIAELLGAKSPGTWAGVIVGGVVVGLIFLWPN